MKHTLKADGAPFYYDQDDRLGPVNEDKSTAGEGVALCSCGATSDVLPTRAARKSWHQTHKENTVTEIPTEQETLPEPEEAEEQLEAEAPETPEDTLLRDVGGFPDKKLLPSYFFADIVRKGAAPILSEHLAVSLKPADGNIVVVSGTSEDDLEAVADFFSALYAVLPEHLASFKKEFKPEAEEPKERHKESWIARRDYCVDFTAGLATEFLGVSGSGSPAFTEGVESGKAEFVDEEPDEDSLI